MEHTLKNISLRDLIGEYDISVRAYNICESLELKTAYDIQRYIQENVNFKEVRNCGERTNKELLDLYKTLTTRYNPSIVQANCNLTFAEEETIETQIKLAYERLGVRATNALFKYFDYNIPNKHIIQKYFIGKEFNPRKVKNIGKGTEKEVVRFVEKTVSLFYNMDSNNLSPEEIAALKISERTGIEIAENSLLQRFITNDFPLVSFVVKHLKLILNLNDIEEFIFKSHFGLFDEEFTLQDLANKFTLRRERIRQKKQTALAKAGTLNKLSAWISNTNYNKILKEKPIIRLDEDIDEKSIFDEFESVGFPLAAFILGNIMQTEYYSMTFGDKVKKPWRVSQLEEYNIMKKLRGAYLIRHTAVPKKIALKLCDTLLNEICERRSSDKYINLSNIIGLDFSAEAIEVVSEIAENEYGFQVQGERIFIPKNTAKQVHEYAFEALVKIGRPSHISEIVQEIQRENPEFDSPPTSVKSCMGLRKNIFIYFGRRSTFGLKTWEQEYKNIKGGTIRDIVEQFLNNYDEPCHLTAITEYVNKYRKTEENSIITNLKMSTSNRFVFLGDNYVGLSSKNYDELRKQKKHELQDISVDDLLGNIFLK